ncbi:MAG: DNA polymerase III subunit gamma/tau [Ruminococcaceae bacterium]|nr:DNA polymerase III subunit gamma/tau [Oscillospiraceae bacterium]
MHQALYRKWRPQTFEDVCGQEHITSILQYEAQNGALSHAYLFCGSRGTGKTTCAKILAKAVNCHNPQNGSPCGKCEACLSIDNGSTTDVLEMDAASNNGVDNIRDIRDEVVYSPSSMRYRVYIIDEVHMLSASAFNALLKTLEEPPEHVIFILATTELQKLPATIISRCQRFDFRRISTDVLVNRLTYIAKEEGITLDAESARMLAKLAQGGMRDAISLLELCAGGGRAVTPDIVAETVGITGREAMIETVRAVAESNYDALFEQIAAVVRSSKDISVFWQDLISIWRDMLILKTTQNAVTYLDLTDHEAEEMKSITALFRKETLIRHCKLLEDALFAMAKANSVKRVIAEMTLVRMCDAALDTSPEAMLSRIAQLEERLDTGTLPLAPKNQEKAEKTTSVVQKQVETVRKAEEKTAPVAEKKPTPASASVPTRTLRTIRSWMEVVERISRSDPMRASFVKSSRAYETEDGKVIVRFGDSFSMQMMEPGEARDRLRTAVSAILKRDVGDRELIFEIAEKRADASVIDEIIDATEN